MTDIRKLTEAQLTYGQVPQDEGEEFGSLSKSVAELRSPADADGVNDVATVAPAVRAAMAAVTQNAKSVYDGAVAGSSANVLASAPPAQTGNYTMEDASSALVRLLMLKNGEPFKMGLTHASEEGTAPAVPKSNHGTDTKATTEAASSSSPASSTSNAAAKGYSYDASKVSNTTDNTAFSEDDILAASKMRQETSNVQDKDCGKKAFVGEDARIAQLTGLGMNYDRAAQIARFLDADNTFSNTMHNDKDEQTVALAIVALDKLDKAGNTEAKDMMLNKLTDLSTQMLDSTKSKQGGESYFQTLNTLGQYALAASADAASVSLSAPTQTASTKLRPYPTVGE